MARRKTARDPFEVRLSPEKETALVEFLSREIEYAEMARDSIVGDHRQIDRAHEMYEQNEGPLTKDTPWEGAANLGSYIVTEKVDALRARIVGTLFTDPIWIVEGYGEAAERASLVEEFHQWKAEQSRLQTYLQRWVHNSLVEGTGVLEVSDRIVHRKGTRRMKALLQRDEQTGAIVLDEQGNPIPVLTKDGRFVDAEEGEPHLQMIVNDVVRATAGPSYRVCSLKSFFILPGHATEREDIWGYVKRVYRRLPELQERERSGFYQNVDQLNSTGERQATPAEQRAGMDIAPQIEETAEKELYECTVLLDLDDDGFEEWYVVTLSVLHRVLLRVQYQDYGTPHYILATPFPRPNSVYGYSYASDKLGTLYDEHAALRNMFADRSALATSAPFLQIEGSPWDPSLRPFGPRQVIPVRDLNELKQLEIRDVPNSVTNAISMVFSAAERLSGQNDVTTGQMAQQDRTLGEVRLVAEQSFVRIDEIIKNFQEGMEDLFDLQHLIWRYKLEQEPEALPGEIMLAMNEHGMQIPHGQVTADLMAGVFRGKPHGSVEGSDFNRMRNEFAQMLTAMTQMAQAVPAVREHLNNPKVIRSIIGQIARVYRWPDRANLVGTFTGEAAPPPAPQLGPAGAPGAPPGGPPGAPPAGGPGPDGVPPEAAQALMSMMGGGS